MEKKSPIFDAVRLSAEYRNGRVFHSGQCFSRLHFPREQMISLVRESNDSPSEFLHPRTCVTEKLFALTVAMHLA